MTRRLALAAVVLGAVATLAPPASASLTCSPLGPVPGWGPVCQVKCLLGAVDVNVKDLGGTVTGLVTHMCPA